MAATDEVLSILEEEEEGTKLNTMNLCIRCGKERVTTRTYKKKVGDSVVVYSETACPDAECQLIVDKQLEKEKLNRLRLVSMNQYPAHNSGRKKVS